ncbi:hypothetical protein DLAC_03627 [Tieghemostelium lacteum]|uniref:TLDc domain-containing protein n=1 Tax=Tieghemostelium lacteum TaxID=361077 RepID=A0A152A0F7_TIELA|nr:hypothetical protein DLAC_03627 [Tieghemostelium lacteum]|eukprot:KYQ99688.1 hypothetical protein DLAC_03627 [Tieghemostelium lacteum]
MDSNTEKVKENVPTLSITISNEEVNETTEDNSHTVNTIRSSLGIPLSPRLSSIRTEEIFKFSVFYIYDDQTRVTGELVLAPGRIIFQGDLNDELVMRDGALKFQLHFCYDKVVSCQMIPTFASDSSLHHNSIAFVILEEDLHGEKKQKEIILECFESDIHQIYRIVKSSMENMESPISISSEFTPLVGDVVVLEEDEEIIEDNNELLKDFIPNLKEGQSTLFKPEDIKPLILYLPHLYQVDDWVLLYKSDLHGISIHTFYDMCKDKGACLIFIRDKNHQVFGGFISESIQCTSDTSYYGNGQCFLFKLLPEFDIFLWSKENHCMVQTTENYLSMGGGSNGKYGIWIDKEFKYGTSSKCLTFNSPTLASQEDFEILEIEVWGFI